MYLDDCIVAVCSVCVHLVVADFVFKNIILPFCLVICFCSLCSQDDCGHYTSQCIDQSNDTINNILILCIHTIYIHFSFDIQYME